MIKAKSVDVKSPIEAIPGIVAHGVGTAVGVTGLYAGLAVGKTAHMKFESKSAPLFQICPEDPWSLSGRGRQLASKRDIREYIYIYICIQSYREKTLISSRTS